MAISTKTIERWKGELESNQRLVSTGAERFRWLRRLYIRVYQFLLSRYVDEPSPIQADNGHRDEEEHVSTMPFVDHTLDHRGLQARSPQSLRYVLQQIHSQQPAAASANIGEQDGNCAPEWVVIATSQDYRLSSCEIVLELRHIKFCRTELGSYQGLEVRFEDRDAAFAALKVYPQKSLRWTKRDRFAARYSWAVKFRLLLLYLILMGTLALFFVVVLRG